MTTERHKDAMHIVSGYTLRLPCCVCNGDKWPELRISKDGTIQEIYAEGPKCYYEARRMARRAGWVFHKDGFASCPRCSD